MVANFMIVMRGYNQAIQIGTSKTRGRKNDCG
jgi:hypothetical protein